MRYKILLFQILGFSAFICILCFYLFFLQRTYFPPNLDLNYYSKLPNSSIPVIKAGTRFFDVPLFANLNIEKGLLRDCPKQCLFMDEKREILKTKIDITLIHARDLKDEVLEEIRYASNMNALGTKVFYSLESPLNTPIYGFNKGLILTYQSNGNGLSRKYDNFERISSNSTAATEVWSDEQITEAIKSKTKGIAILVSNCETLSSREYLIEALSQQLPISIYGKCSKINCDSKCETQAIKDHFFYLAFENSVCNEYVTEKFWRLKDLIVPVVLSRNATASVAPNGSFIAADDFKSAENLARHLKFLMNNLEEYKKYFSWTKIYKKTYNPPRLACNLCKFAWELRENPTKAKSMLPTYEEWMAKSQCKLNYGLSLMTRDELNNTSFFPLTKKLLFLIISLLFLFSASFYAYRTLSFAVPNLIMSRFSKS